MNLRSLSQLLAFGLVAVTMTACSMFRRDAGPPGPTTMQDFDPVTNSWTSSRGAVTPGPSQPAAPMERAKPAEEKVEKENFFKRAYKKLPFTGS